VITPTRRAVAVDDRRHAACVHAPRRGGGTAGRLRVIYMHSILRAKILYAAARAARFSPCVVRLCG